MSRRAEVGLSTEQAIAYESASHQLGHLVDDVAHAVFRVWGEQSALGILAEEARWDVFLLHDRVATHAMRDAGALAHELTLRTPAPEDLAWPRANRFDVEADLHAALGAALSRCSAILAGMAGGYARCCAHTHSLMIALRGAQGSVLALRAALSSASCFDRIPRPALAGAQQCSLPAPDPGEAAPPGPITRRRARRLPARYLRARPAMRWR